MKKLTERCWKMLVLILLFQPNLSILFVLEKKRFAATSSVLGQLVFGLQTCFSVWLYEVLSA